MKVVILHNRYHLTGGPERYLFDLEERLRERGHTPIPFTVRYRQNRESPYEKYFVPPPGRDDAVYFRDVKDVRGRVRLLVRSVYSWETRCHLRRLIADERPDLAFALTLANFLSPSALTECRNAGLPTVMRLSDFHPIVPCYHFFDGESVCEACVSGSRLNAVRKRCLQGSRLVSMVRVLGMGLHERLGLYDGVDRFVTPSEFLRMKFAIQAAEAEEEAQQ